MFHIEETILTKLTDDLSGKLSELVSFHPHNQLPITDVVDALKNKKSPEKKNNFVFIRYRLNSANSRRLQGFVLGRYRTQYRDRPTTTIRKTTLVFSIDIVIARPGQGSPMMNAFLHADVDEMQNDIAGRRVVFELYSVPNKVNFYLSLKFQFSLKKVEQPVELEQVTDDDDVVKTESKELVSLEQVESIPDNVIVDQDGLPKMYLVKKKDD
jgi:hypothetical protein